MLQSLSAVSIIACFFVSLSMKVLFGHRHRPGNAKATMTNGTQETQSSGNDLRYSTTTARTEFSRVDDQVRMGMFRVRECAHAKVISFPRAFVLLPASLLYFHANSFLPSVQHHNRCSIYCIRSAFDTANIQGREAQSTSKFI